MPENLPKSNFMKKKKLAASSMQHEAKIAYYAFDVIRFFVPYAARLKLCGRVAYGLRGTRTLFTRRQAVAIAT